MNTAVKILSTTGVALALALGGTLAAHADDAPAPSYKTVAWLMPSYVDGTTSTWPQTLSNTATTSTPSLGALDAYLADPAHCGRAFQVDVYNASDITSTLIAKGHLTAPNAPQEDLIAGGWGTAYKIVKTADCPLPTVAILPVTTTPATCTADATYTVPFQPTGVKYALAVPTDPTSARPVPGTFTLADGVSLTINAHSIDGYVPVSYTTTVTGHSKLPATDAACAVVTPPTTTPVPPVTTDISVSKTVATPSLAFTGATTGWLVWPAGALLVLGSIFMVARRKFIR